MRAFVENVYVYGSEKCSFHPAEGPAAAIGVDPFAAAALECDRASWGDASLRVRSFRRG